MSSISGSRFIAETFKAYGVTHVFYVPAILNKALVEMDSLGIQRVMTHTEKAAAYMADGYARVSHRPGICMAQSVGAANLAAGLQDPYLALAPVIALTGQKPPMFQYRNAYQEIVHKPLFEPVTKCSVRVDTAEQLPYLLRQAFRETTSGSPGPTHLDIKGRLGQIIDSAQIDQEVVIEESFSHYPSTRPEPNDQHIRKVAEMLVKAEKPVIVAGGGVTASSAGPEVVELAEMLSIPVATSLNGKGTIVENSPLSVGVVGTYSLWAANRIVSEADLVVFIGSHTSDQVTNNWTVPKQNVTILQIDIDPLELGRNYPGTVGVMGDAKVSVRRLIESIDPKAAQKTSWAEYAQRMVKACREEQEPRCSSNAVPIRPERLCKELTDFLPSDAILVSDTGYAGIWTGTMVGLNHPAQSYIRAAGSLGWAVPASLGAKCAAPDRPVICFTGDGGMWYHMSELETAVRCGIKTITVVNNNHCLRQCFKNIDLAHGNRPTERDSYYKFRETNFARLAIEMDCVGIRVERPDEIAGALKKALAAEVPAVVEVITDAECEPTPPWTPQLKQYKKR